MSALSASEAKQAEVLVGHIIQLFSDTQELAKKYTGKQSDLVAIDNDSDDLGVLRSPVSVRAHHVSRT